MSNYLNTKYRWAALNTLKIGQFLGEAVQQLTLPPESIHLIGFSLGAHIVGYAGSHYQKLTGQKLARITGLDPAKECFKQGTRLRHISSEDAQFVDIIHSSTGVVGNIEHFGDADFYVNGYEPFPPGCKDDDCAHERAWEYYAESVYVGNENNFMAKICESPRKFKRDQCEPGEYPMGYNASSQGEGRLFLSVNPEKPYGKNGSGELLEKYENCGLCLAK